MTVSQVGILVVACFVCACALEEPDELRYAMAPPDDEGTGPSEPIEPDPEQVAPTRDVLSDVPDLKQALIGFDKCGPERFYWYEVCSGVSMTNILRYHDASAHPVGTKASLHALLQDPGDKQLHGCDGPADITCGEDCWQDQGLSGGELATDTHLVSPHSYGIVNHNFDAGNAHDRAAMLNLVKSEISASRPLIFHAQNNPDLAHALSSHSVTVVGWEAPLGGPYALVVHDNHNSIAPGTKLTLPFSNMGGTVIVTTVMP